MTMNTHFTGEQNEAPCRPDAVGSAAPTHQQKLQAFFDWAVGEIWGGFSLEIGGDVIQDKALEFGLLRRVPYNPAVHGAFAQDEYDLKPGDEWLERMPATAALQVGTKDEQSPTGEGQQS